MFPQNAETVMVPTRFVNDQGPVFLEMPTFKPQKTDGGPLPVVVFNHGSTGLGNNPEYFVYTYTDQHIVQYFTSRGWMVVFPQRRGRGASGGLYDEGFTKTRSRYSISPKRSLAGLERAMEDIDEVVASLKADPSVDSSRMVIGGVSRGGLLAVAYAGTRPDVFLGAINFVGGWIGEFKGSGLYRLFYDYMEKINTVSFVRGAGFPGPVIWLYAENDRFYSIRHSRANFDAFIEAGGKGTFHPYSLGKGIDGHRLCEFPHLWEDVMDAFLALCVHQ
ncbi:MAG: prolyl oligopeptidase family serine peptidase [Spirochaetales bacterium]|nr:prolyl oligopeptidase family serine peptidase [Spirochaetales bacterium]